MRPALAVLMLSLAACGPVPPEEEGADSGSLTHADAGPGMDAGTAPVDCASDAGASACYAAAIHLAGCCGTASTHGADEPVAYCQSVARLALDPVQRCADIAAASCAQIRAQPGLCH